jgi:K+-sensing histidine kinase KdpD
MAGQSDDSKRAALQGGSSRLSNPLSNPQDLAKVLALVSHDLRNPLAALLSNVGFLQMISDEMSEEAREAVGDVLLSVEAIGRIVDSLELVGRDLGDRAAEQASTLTAGGVVRSVEPAVQRAAVSHELTLQLDVAQHENTRFIASEHSFSRALSALIHNGLTVAPPRSTVIMRVLTRERALVFRLEDQGSALSPKMEQLVRSAVEQDNLKADRGARYSRGLGLFTVARFAEISGAQFAPGQAESGSALELIVPLAP